MSFLFPSTTRPVPNNRTRSSSSSIHRETRRPRRLLQCPLIMGVTPCITLGLLLTTAVWLASFCSSFDEYQSAYDNSMLLLSSSSSWSLPSSSSSSSSLPLKESSNKNNTNTNNKNNSNHHPTIKDVSRKNNNVNRSSFWLTFGDYHSVRNHVYAAAWWQSLTRFAEMPVQNITKLEAACHVAVEMMTTQQSNTTNEQVVHKDDIRLTRDWLQFSVEHLSKWWKATRYQKYQTSFETMAKKMVNYILQQPQQHQRAQPSQQPQQHPMSQTLAVVAYAPLHGPRHSQRAQVLDALVLSATLTSLVRVGVPRIVVVTDQSDFVYASTHIWPAVEMLLLLLQQQPNQTQWQHNRHDWRSVLDKIILQVAAQAKAEEPHASHTEKPLSYLELPIKPSSSPHQHQTIVLWGTDTSFSPQSGQGQARGKRPQKLVPRAALVEAHEALFGTTTTRASSAKQQHLLRRVYLGIDDYENDNIIHNTAALPFQYIYYTEQDSLLHMSHNDNINQENAVAQAFTTALNNGHLLLPHRWQPMPHASDFSENEDAVADLPNTFYVPAVPPWDKVQTLSDIGNKEQLQLQQQQRQEQHLVACCDAGIESTIDFTSSSSPCQDYWYLCGLGRHANTTTTTAAVAPDAASLSSSPSVDNLQHLRHFALIRLSEGSNLTLLAASEHARQCRPSLTPCH